MQPFNLCDRFMIPKRQTKKSSSCCILDIETVAADEKRLLALAPNFEAPGNIKDPIKIAANIEEQKRKFIERAALSWRTCEIVLIGLIDDGVYVPIYTSEPNEKWIIENFFKGVSQWIKEGRKFGGHNVKGFDLPLIVNRARVLGIPLPDGLLSYYNGRPSWSELVYDTMEELSFGPYNMDGNGVDDVAKAFGLPTKSGTGAQFPSLWKSDREAAIQYNKTDCEIEKLIAMKLGYKF